MTVTTTTSLNGISWQDCGTIGTDGALGISRDYTMIICPDVVNFEGAAAWGQTGGFKTWYRSMYASAPIVQAHEIVSFVCTLYALLSLIFFFRSFVSMLTSTFIFI